MEDNGEAISLRKRYGKLIVKFFGMLVGVFLLYVVGFWVVRWYNLWQGQKRVNDLAQAMQRASRDSYDRAMQDTYGGKTPQETLRMYIDAVEKGDYELASKYFIEDKREEEKKNLINASAQNIKNIMTLIKAGLQEKGEYGLDKKTFIVDKPLYIREMIYPNNIWKIIEI